MASIRFNKTELSKFNRIKTALRCETNAQCLDKIIKRGVLWQNTEEVHPGVAYNEGNARGKREPSTIITWRMGDEQRKRLNLLKRKWGGDDSTCIRNALFRTFDRDVK